MEKVNFYAYNTTHHDEDEWFTDYGIIAATSYVEAVEKLVYTSTPQNVKNVDYAENDLISINSLYEIDSEDIGILSFGFMFDEFYNELKKINKKYEKEAKKHNELMNGLKENNE